jgi:hypothetical protein
MRAGTNLNDISNVFTLDSAGDILFPQAIFPKIIRTYDEVVNPKKLVKKPRILSGVKSTECE